MPADRFYVNASLNPAKTVRIEGMEFHHLNHVMRISVGECIEIVNGAGSLARGAIQSIDKKCASVEIIEMAQQPSPSFQVILAQAIPRMNRLEAILEKGTELGMSEIWLFPAAHSEKKALTEHQIERMQAIAIAAMKQSGRLYLPAIKILPELKHWASPVCPAFFGDLSPSALLFENRWREMKPKDSSIFFVGPESGFNDKELALLKTLGVQGVRLHPNILRTDTAAIAALALIGHWIQW